MAATQPASKPRTCPSCGEGYVSRIHRRRMEDFGLAGMYRCVHGSHVYLHRIDNRQASFNWGREGRLE